LQQTTTTNTQARPEDYPVDRGFALRQYFGRIFPEDVPDEAALQIGKAILCVAGADQEITSKEWATYFGLARTYASTEAVNMIRGFDYKRQKLEQVITPELKPMAKLLVYESIRIARADGFADRERQAAVKVCKLLGVDPGIVPAIEGLLKVEDSLVEARELLLAPTMNGR
jgi:hypothetical protein